MEEEGSVDGEDSVGGLVPASHSTPPFPGTVSSPLTKKGIGTKV